VAVETDEQRLQQVLKNLLSNAFKFTAEGEVSLRIDVADPGTSFNAEPLRQAAQVLAFEVLDTGIGMAEDKLHLIFEAFQQADGTTSRRYGGTGLGLSISREISRLLGGEIHVRSSEGVGSTFTLYLPVGYRPPTTIDVAGDDEPIHALNRAVAALVPPAAATVVQPPTSEDRGVALTGPNELDDDRDAIAPGDRVLLVADDDREVARTALGLGRAAGCKTVATVHGDGTVALARALRPDAILLDADLRTTAGPSALEVLKRHPTTRHIPVLALSSPEGRQDVIARGAALHLLRPTDGEALAEALGGLLRFAERTAKHLLVVDDDEHVRTELTELLGGDDVQITAVGTIEGALEALEASAVDCMVLDLRLDEESGFTLLERLHADQALRDLPVIIYTAKDLTRQEEVDLARYADTVVVKDARSPERLLDETALYLHRATSRLPVAKRRMLDQLRTSNAAFEGRKVLVVDDDIRNVFALGSALESRGMEVLFAENGRDGLETLERNPDVDIVLMDVMMPEMDGYETTAAIRRLPAYATLPIISLTAKAMKGDREKSIAAGASDYITKPLDIDQLLSLMRVWLDG
jgi:CheY-like chemotaxis protein